MCVYAYYTFMYACYVWLGLWSNEWKDCLIAWDALLGADVQQDSVYPNPRMSGSQLAKYSRSHKAWLMKEKPPDFLVNLLNAYRQVQ